MELVYKRKRSGVYLAEKLSAPFFERKLFGIFNPRPLPLCLLYLAAGIALAIIQPQYCGLWYACLALSAGYLYLLRVAKRGTVWLLLLCLCLSLQVFGYRAYFQRELHPSAQNVVLSGRVISLEKQEEGAIMVLDDLYIDGDPFAGKARVYATEGCEVGMQITAHGNLKTYYLQEDAFSVRRVAYKTYYDFNATDYQVNAYVSLPFRAAFLENARRLFTERTDENTADFAMSVLFGQSKRLDSALLGAFREVNLAHLFAVSGLHVGTLTAIVCFFFIKIGKKKRYSLAVFITLTLLLFAYAFLCDFSPSVVRASIMTLLASLLVLLQIFPDRLSVWSAAALGSLLVRPLWLFDVSFLLSYGAILGILLLEPLFARLLAKSKLPKGLRGAVAVDIAVSFAVVPVSVYFFGGASWLSLPLALLFIPVVSLLFVWFLLSLPLLGLSFSSVLLFPAKLLVYACDFAVLALARLDATFGGSFALIALLPWFAALFLASDFCLLPAPRKRLSTALCALSALLITLV